MAIIVYILLCYLALTVFRDYAAFLLSSEQMCFGCVDA